MKDSEARLNCERLLLRLEDLEDAVTELQTCLLKQKLIGAEHYRKPPGLTNEEWERRQGPILDLPRLSQQFHVLLDRLGLEIVLVRELEHWEVREKRGVAGGGE